jgi:hypothetical protein
MADTPHTEGEDPITPFRDGSIDVDSEDVESAILEFASRISSLESQLALTQRRADRLEAVLDKSLDPAPSEFLPEETDSLDRSVFYTLYADSPMELSRSHFRDIYQNWTSLEDIDKIDQRISVLTSSSVFDKPDSEADVWAVEFPFE